MVYWVSEDLRKRPTSKENPKPEGLVSDNWDLVRRLGRPFISCLGGI